jgi:hypothetical protein
MRFDRPVGKNLGGNEEPAMQHAPAKSRDQDQDLGLDQALGDFRASVLAWSDAAYSCSRPIVTASARAGWRKAAAWALGCVLAAGIAGGGVLENQHRQALARIAAEHEAQRQRALVEQRAREAEQELATIDSDVAREVPHAMEPLAQLMTDGGQ